MKNNLRLITFNNDNVGEFLKEILQAGALLLHVMEYNTLYDTPLWKDGQVGPQGKIKKKSEREKETKSEEIAYREKGKLAPRQSAVQLLAAALFLINAHKHIWGYNNNGQARA